MEGLIMTAQLLLGLSILVILHEAGHFLAARAFGIRVEKFFLFFDVNDIKLFSFKKNNTEYGVGWLPLGGYVKLAGMIDESLDTEALKAPPQPWEFRSKPAWQRLIVMVGGVTVNLLLGMVIFASLTFIYGEQYIPMNQLKYGIVALELGKEMGLQTGDKILKVNGKEAKKFTDAFDSRIFIDRNVTFTVDRNGEIIEIPVPTDLLQKFSKSKGENFIDYRKTFYVEALDPANNNALKAGIIAQDRIVEANGEPIRFFDEFKDILASQIDNEIGLVILRGTQKISLKCAVNSKGQIGIGIGIDGIKPEVVQYGFIESIGRGSYKAFDILYLNIRGLGKIFRGEISASESVTGPIGIAAIYGGFWDWLKFWSITGVLSMVLAFMNILPIPALDGGHVFFLSVEAVTGKKFSDKFMENVQKVGLAILLTLMALIIGNDIFKLFQ